ncbi:hypothetical protein RVF83_21280 [Gordonia rubripertincta]|uniref:Uncharacterized protein n=2 Tax=Gordonia rubripertincta TaxID=36822 RepID=A0AAW6R569_GORRU|nr:hypothetical protein [Gordonia rubripertincta]MDG6779688.1 hypothetical protein [Gordonia rubripertincta]NKY63676.1 hypothetical protein [Gordonia rubripertincta]GAB85959.1 hypothetical protein GORBP_068_00230 [Gordonia rubripertincta NBRC 101908]
MLTLALGATLIGFVLLILGLITGTVWLAVACIVICLLGLAFLLVDVFSGRNRDSARSLEDMVPGAGRDEVDTDSDDAGFAGGRSDADESRTRRHPTAMPSARDSDTGEATVAYEQPSFEPGMGAPSGPTPSRPVVPESRPAHERREGNLEDYLRSVGEPVGQPNSGPTPVPGPAPSGRGAPGQPPRAPYQAPGQQSPGGQPSRPDPSPLPQYGNPPSGPQQQYGQPPSGQRASGQRPAWPQGQDSARPDPAQSGERPQGEQPEPPEPRPGRRRAADFDPLDPNWRPPLD